jgi:hypothetical protein
MVDPIEVKLDEIEDHVLKTQADVDRLMRDFSKPEKGKELLAQLPGGGGGGFLSQVMGAMGGGKGGGIMGAGLAGGLAAGGIMALVDILKEAVSNSKILATVLGTIGKALGLLIDVILLPFLPILTTGIIWLFQGIMLFYKFWTGVWSGKTFQLLKDGIVSLGTAIAKGIGGLLSLGINFLGAAGNTIWSFLQWVWDIATKGAAAVISLAFSAAGIVYDLLKWLWDTIVKFSTNTVSLTFSVLGAAYDFLKWLWDTITTGGANLVINLTQGASSAVSSAVSGAGSLLSGAGNFLSGLLHFDQGGTVPGTGPQLAVVHGGENITPAGQGGGHTFNFYGYDDAKLKKSVENILRQQNNRYNA